MDKCPFSVFLGVSQAPSLPPSKVMDKFEQSFEDMDVRSEYVEQVFGRCKQSAVLGSPFLYSPLPSPRATLPNPPLPPCPVDRR